MELFVYKNNTLKQNKKSVSIGKESIGKHRKFNMMNISINMQMLLV